MNVFWSGELPLEEVASAFSPLLNSQGRSWALSLSVTLPIPSRQKKIPLPTLRLLPWVWYLKGVSRSLWCSAGHSRSYPALTSLDIAACAAAFPCEPVHSTWPALLEIVHATATRKRGGWDAPES